MITPITIKNITFGEGLPKICIPIVGTTEEEILKSASALSEYTYDVAEWRMDFFEGVSDLKRVENILKFLKDILKDHLLLATFRTAKEGGEREIDDEYYCQLNRLAAKSGADLIDIELFTGDEVVEKLVQEIHAANAFIIMSNHDFHKTPSKETIIERLTKMQDLGADIAKIAVMPNTPDDVLTLLSATAHMQAIEGGSPVVTMSMGRLGLISRLSGSIFGSAMTFGSAGKASAPGQIDAKELNDILHIIK